MKKVVTAFIALSAIAWTYLNSSNSIADEQTNLIKLLVEMGYEDVRIDKCEVTFSKSLSPVQENNYIYKYTRVIHVNYIDVPSKFDIETINGNTKPHYLIKAFFNNNYKYGSKYEVNKLGDDLQLADINTDEMDLWIGHSQTGKSIKIQSWFNFTYSDALQLDAFGDAIIAYAAKEECN